MERLKGLCTLGSEDAFVQSFPINSFWLACTRQERAGIPPAVLDRMIDTAVVLSRSEETGLFEKREKPVKELIASLNGRYFINVNANQELKRKEARAAARRPKR